MDYYTPRPGDVVRYTPSTNWCREGIAIAQDQLNTRNGIQRHVLLDTYWHLGTETHVLEDNDHQPARPAKTVVHPQGCEARLGDADRERASGRHRPKAQLGLRAKRSPLGQRGPCSGHR